MLILNNIFIINNTMIQIIFAFYISPLLKKIRVNNIDKEINNNKNNEILEDEEKI